jgi:hypothetical protein
MGVKQIFQEGKLPKILSKSIIFQNPPWIILDPPPSPVDRAMRPIFYWSGFQNSLTWLSFTGNFAVKIIFRQI